MQNQHITHASLGVIMHNLKHYLFVRPLSSKTVKFNLKHIKGVLLSAANDSSF